MKKLMAGVVNFKEKIRPQMIDTFRKLGQGQSPDVLFITCSDSRVVPNLFTSADPGELFVMRNAGNFFPAHVDSNSDTSVYSEHAGLEFALNVLQVQNIIVCGHSNCGAMKASLAETPPALPLVCDWLEHAAATKEKLSDIDSYLAKSPDDAADRFSQLNVLQQIEHLKNHPLVRKYMDEDRLQLHSWWFDIGNANVHQYDPNLKEFTIINAALVG